MNTNGAVNKKLKKIADKIVNAAIENMKEEVGSQIEKEYELCIESFYDHYKNPKFYKRTESTFYASDSYDVIATSWMSHGNRIGIYVSADNIPGNPYYVPGKYGMRKIVDEDDNVTYSPVDKDWVFENTFAHGMHGYPPYNGHYPMDVPPLKKMNAWFKKFKSDKTIQDMIKNDALEKAIAKYT